MAAAAEPAAGGGGVRGASPRGRSSFPGALLPGPRRDPGGSGTAVPPLPLAGSLPGRSIPLPTPRARGAAGAQPGVPPPARTPAQQPGCAGQDRTLLGSRRGATGPAASPSPSSGTAPAALGWPLSQPPPVPPRQLPPSPLSTAGLGQPGVPSTGVPGPASPCHAGCPGVGVEALGAGGGRGLVSCLVSRVPGAASAAPPAPTGVPGPRCGRAGAKGRLSSRSVPAGERGRGEHGALPLLPAALHGAAAQRGALHPHHRGRQEVGRVPPPALGPSGCQPWGEGDSLMEGGGRSPAPWEGV